MNHGALSTKFAVIKVRFTKKRNRWMPKRRIIRRPWTKEDLRTLKSMARDKQGVTKIAKALKRTDGATRAMAVKRRVSLSTRG